MQAACCAKTSQTLPLSLAVSSCTWRCIVLLHTHTHTFTYFAGKGGTYRCLALHACAHSLSTHALSFWGWVGWGCRFSTTSQRGKPEDVDKETWNDTDVAVVQEGPKHFMHVCCHSIAICTYCISDITLQLHIGQSRVYCIGCIFEYYANIATLSCSRSKRDATDA